MLPPVCGTLQVAAASQLSSLQQQVGEVQARVSGVASARARAAAELAAAEERAAGVAGRLPEVEAEKKVAAAKKVSTETPYVVRVL